MKPNFTFNLGNRFSNIKVLPLLAGVVSIALSAATIPAVLAQSNNKPPEGLHQNRLNLTAEQQQKIQQIKQSERDQMDKILTAEQKARLERARQNRENPRQVFESLNLTEQQKAQMDAVRRATKEQMDAILTAEQRQQMEQHRPGGEGFQPPQ